MCGLHLHLNATATMRLVNRRGLGKVKHVDRENLWIQEASKSKRFFTKKGYEREPRRHDDETTAGTEDCAAFENHELGICGTILEARRMRWYEIGGRFDGREGEG